MLRNTLRKQPKLQLKKAKISLHLPMKKYSSKKKTELLKKLNQQLRI
jgi:hypothetical protein